MYHIDFESMIQENHTTHSRIVSKLLSYNKMGFMSTFYFPIEHKDDIHIPKLGDEHSNEYMPPRR